MFKKLFNKKRKNDDGNSYDVINKKIVSADEELIELMREVKEQELNNTEVKAQVQKVGVFKKLFNGLSKTRSGFTDKLDRLFNQYGTIDEELYEELEEILIMSDIGMETTIDIMEKLREEITEKKIKEPKQIKNVLRDVLIGFLATEDKTKLEIGTEPVVILVIGVNGAGKTTSIGKIGALLKSKGHEVLLSAADTFRAAASEQLKVWAERIGVDIIHQGEGADPAAVVFDSIKAAKARNAKVLICDTAGRLHNKKNLMNELQKIFRVIEREYPEAKKEVLLVLDATTGQNAIQQAKLFKETAQITGIVLTKLDGTAKGGAVLAIYHTLGMPVKFIGVGEGIDDLQEFNPSEFVNAILGE